jgi:hypothetical protein
MSDGISTTSEAPAAAASSNGASNPDSAQIATPNRAPALEDLGYVGAAVRCPLRHPETHTHTQLPRRRSQPAHRRMIQPDQPVGGRR